MSDEEDEFLSAESEDEQGPADAAPAPAAPDKGALIAEAEAQAKAKAEAAAAEKKAKAAAKKKAKAEAKKKTKAEAAAKAKAEAQAQAEAEAAAKAKAEAQAQAEAEAEAQAQAKAEANTPTLAAADDRGAPAAPAEHTPPPMRASKARKANRQRAKAAARAAEATPAAAPPDGTAAQEPVEAVVEAKPSPSPAAVTATSSDNGGGGGWGGWGLSSVLSAVADGVTAVADQVVDVLDEAETSSAPSSRDAAAARPAVDTGISEDKARDKVEMAAPSVDTVDEASPRVPAAAAAPAAVASGFSMASMFSSVASAVETAADTVVSTLDADLGESDAAAAAAPSQKDRARKEAASCLADAIRHAKAQQGAEAGGTPGGQDQDQAGSATPAAGGDGDLVVGDLFAVEKKVQDAVLTGLGTVGRTVGEGAFSLIKQALPPKQGGGGGGGGGGSGDTGGVGDGAAENEDAAESPDQRPTFKVQFERAGGQARLDALQLLAGTAEARVSSLMGLRQGKHRTKMARFLNTITQILEIDDDDDDEDMDETADGTAAIEEAVTTLQGVASTDRVTADILQTAFAEESAAFDKVKSETEAEVLNDTVVQEAVRGYAAVATALVQVLRQLGEEALLEKERQEATEEDHLKTVESKGRQIAAAARIVQQRVAAFASQYQGLLQQGGGGADADEVNAIGTAVFLEAHTATELIGAAVAMVTPVLQLSALK